MLNDNDQTWDLNGSEAPIVTGTPVYDAAGQKVGDVGEHNPQGGYLVVHKGFLFPKDIYVPLSAIAHKTTDGVYLDTTKDRINEQGWDQPPSNGTVRSDRGTSRRKDTNLRDNGAHATPVREDDVAVPIAEEELAVDKQRTEAGRVHVNRDVEEEEQSIDVPVTHEEVVVEHVPVAGRGDISDDAFTDRDIDIPVMGEEVQTEKRAVVKDELHLHKRAVTENQRVSDTVRKERVNVEGEDDQGRMPLDGGDQDTLQTNRP